MSINLELLFDFKSQDKFDIHPRPSNYTNFMEEWLKSINLSKYYPNFKLAGYDNFAYLIYQEQSQYKLTSQDFKDCFLLKVKTLDNYQLLIQPLFVIK
ncbi:unnamed protein product [Paramecium sonneborni]|uniref:SAM domain-containing protein n=1 Tax=Paramecium sonneborni TaxID=65129 RepID=A0A8S1RW50_9CILI|nr:unnamed protein product [Paramecium sonneborni]